MAICTICRNNITTEDPAILYVNAAGVARCVCADCEMLLSLVADGEDRDAIGRALDTLRRHLMSSRDLHAMRLLNELVEDNPAAAPFRTEATDVL